MDNSSNFATDNITTIDHNFLELAKSYVVVHECPPVSSPMLCSNGRQAQQGLVTDATPLHFRLNTFQMAAPRVPSLFHLVMGLAPEWAPHIHAPPKISIKEARATPRGSLFGLP